MLKNKVVISGINIFEGGPLTIFKDVLNEVSNRENFEIIALVHNKLLFEEINNSNIKYIEFKFSRKSYFLRLFYEYIYFYFFSLKLKPYLWISLHDISPNIVSKYKIVYLHNATAFSKVDFKYIFLQPKIFFFTLFYKYFYKINLNSNNFIIVQQCWFKNIIIKKFNINSRKILISYPIFNFNFEIEESNQSNHLTFFYPSLPRVFKNHEILCKSVIKLLENNYHNFKIIFTIDGTENLYSRFIYNKYSKISNLDFKGIQNKHELNALYNKSHILLFPSKIESWGLPLSEFKMFDKPIFCSELPYARETLNGYSKVSFFNPDSIIEIYNLMKNAIENKYSFDDSNNYLNHNIIYANWEELFNEIFNYCENEI
jgi:hypothetical protein